MFCMFKYMFSMFVLLKTSSGVPPPPPICGQAHRGGVYECKHAEDAGMHVCVCMHVYMHACMYGCIHACMHDCMHVCVYVCMYECMHTCMHVCVYVYMYVSPELFGLLDSYLRRACTRHPYARRGRVARPFGVFGIGPENLAAHRHASVT